MLKGHSPDLYDLAQSLNENIRTSSLRSGTNRPDDIRLPTYHAGQSTRTFLSSIPDLWNELPTEIQCSTTQSIFKSHLKSELLSNYGERAQCNNPTCIDVRYHI